MKRAQQNNPGKSIAERSDSRKKTPRAPAALFITGLCQNNCIFCFESEINSSRYVLRAKKVIEIMEGLRAGGARSVDLIGGEPLLHPELEQIVDAASLLGMRVNLTTNGLALADRRLAERILPRISSMVVSIHAGEKEAYRLVTGNPEGFDRLRRALAIVRELGQPERVMFNTTLTRTSLDSLQGILSLVMAFGCARWDITNPFPLGNCGKNYPAIAPRLAKVSAVLQALIPRAREAGVEVRFSYFPMCAIGYDTACSNDLLEPSRASGYRVNHRLNPHHRGDLIFERIFGRTCQKCAIKKNRRCFGLPAIYLRVFGESELRPLCKEALP